MPFPMRGAVWHCASAFCPDRVTTPGDRACDAISRARGRARAIERPGNQEREGLTTSDRVENAEKMRKIIMEM